MLQNKAEIALVTDPEEREGGRASEVLQNKAKFALVTDPEGERERGRESI